MTDYWLNKLMFDLQAPGGKERWANEREAVLEDYPVSPKVRQALLDDDMETIQPLANPYLIRVFLLISGYDDAQSMEILHALHKEEEKVDG